MDTFDETILAGLDEAENNPIVYWGKVHRALCKDRLDSIDELRGNKIARETLKDGGWYRSKDKWPRFYCTDERKLIIAVNEFMEDLDKFTDGWVTTYL